MQAIGSDDYMSAGCLSEREKACVLWAEHVTKNTAKSRDDVFERVRGHFSESEMVELTMVITYFNMRNRFQDSLRIPLEGEESINRVKRGKRQDPSNLGGYLADIVEKWPPPFPPVPE